jgi:hypothetical protein
VTINMPGRPGELARAYEALRAQATGESSAATPRGLALFLSAGFPVWMKNWAPLTPTVPAPSPPRRDHVGQVRLGGDVARLLTEMALGCHRRWATT